MVYNFIVKLLGSGIASIIAFLPLILNINDNNLVIQTTLTDPITEDIKNLTAQGYEFKIEYYCSIIINDRKTLRKQIFRNLRQENDVWFIDNIKVQENELQNRMGILNFNFNGITLTEKDKIDIFIMAKILPDKIFYESTGLKTKILWNYYIPRIKESYILINGKLKAVK